MVNEHGNLTIVDFGLGGLNGSPIPLHKQTGMKRKSGTEYSISQDLERIARLEGMVNFCRSNKASIC